MSRCRRRCAGALLRAHFGHAVLPPQRGARGGGQHGREGVAEGACAEAEGCAAVEDLGRAKVRVEVRRLGLGLGLGLGSGLGFGLGLEIGIGFG